MQRYLYAVLIIGVIVLASLFFLYRTTPPPTFQEPEAAGATFGGVSLSIEYATTTAAREKGLGSRTSIPSNYGMLFVFPKDDTYGFWMKDTLIPLDMFWLDAQGHVVSIAMNVATSSYPDVFYPSAPARYVLETNAGFATAHGIATGTPLLLPNWSIVSQ